MEPTVNTKEQSGGLGTRLRVNKLSCKQGMEVVKRCQLCHYICQLVGLCGLEHWHWVSVVALSACDVWVICHRIYCGDGCSRRLRLEIAFGSLKDEREHFEYIQRAGVPNGPLMTIFVWCNGSSPVDMDELDTSTLNLYPSLRPLTTCEDCMFTNLRGEMFLLS